MDIDDSILLIIDDPQGIIDQQLRPCPIHVLNVIIILINCLKLGDISWQFLLPGGSIGLRYVLQQLFSEK